ncbi:MAG: glycosyltransferase [Flavobacteriaceae bacterium]|nr:glycosyltransferase [Flavobacteriaceae bacterium]
MTKVSNNQVSFVMTSCNRFDLMEITISSFLKHNTFPIEQYIFIEDTNKKESLQKVINKFPELNGKYLLLYNEPKLGQIKSIDKAYSYVNTPYIFHCEEDWEFYRSGFIEDSLQLLEEESQVISIWIRNLNDTNKHPVLPTRYSTKSGVNYYKLETNYLNTWHGFTFNPGLRRLKDYKLLGCYKNVGHEQEINVAYNQKKFFGAILEKDAVRHIGWHRRVLDTDKKRNKLIQEMDAFVKKQKASLYKLLGIFGKKYSN